MPTRNALLDRHLAALETAEQRAARQLATVYNQARREIVADLISGWNQSAISGPADAERFLRNSGLLSQIDARMKQLEQQVNLQLRGIVTSSTEAGIDQIRQELALLPASIRDGFTGTFDQINNRMIERFLYPAEDGVRLATTSTALTLRRELSVGVVQGEAFPTLVRRLMAATPTGEGQAVWVNGQLSAERMVRRTVIAAENGAKVEAIGEVQAQIPEVKKQWIAAIGKNTTDCCLRAHGQIVANDAMFELVGEPRFADRVPSPPGHWSCRSSVAMWHPAFEASGPTSKMKDEAKVELQRRTEDKDRPRRPVSSRSTRQSDPLTPDTLLSEWVTSSGRRTSVILKNAIKEELGVAGLIIDRRGFNIASSEIAGAQTSVRAMYERTQAELRAQGITEVKLYRGVKTGIRTPGAVESWTTDLRTARKFDGYDVMEMTVPVDRIFMYSGGPGWKNGKYGEQREYMILGSSPTNSTARPRHV